MEISRTVRKRLSLLLLGGALLLVIWPQGVLRAEIGAIGLYQVVGSPVAAMVSRCRFQPTCSHYALAVLERDGLWKGNAQVAKRLLLCSPLGFLLDQLS